MASFEDLGLRRELFWDIKKENIQLALSNSREWVIVRVFEYGDLIEINKIIKFYGEDFTKKALLETNLRPMARAMADLFLSLKTEKNEERPLYYK
jgi:hypothetical protein